MTNRIESGNIVYAMKTSVAEILKFKVVLRVQFPAYSNFETINVHGNPPTDLLKKFSVKTAFITFGFRVQHVDSLLPGNLWKYSFRLKMKIKIVLELVRSW